METLPFPANLEQNESRFWELVDNFTKSSDECWPWVGGRWHGGYGVFKLNLNGEWKRYKAHRVAYRLHYGIELKNLGCHTCDNPWCVNPFHIFDGTSADNSRDMVKKGRAPSGERSGRRTKPHLTARGERSGNAKLTEDDVRDIRKMYVRFPAGSRPNPTIAAIIEKYGLDRTYIHRIVTRRSWAHVID